MKVAKAAEDMSVAVTTAATTRTVSISRNSTEAAAISNESGASAANTKKRPSVRGMDRHPPEGLFNYRFEFYGA
jgi:hypothetical protein